MSQIMSVDDLPVEGGVFLSTDKLVVPVLDGAPQGQLAVDIVARAAADDVDDDSLA